MYRPVLALLLLVACGSDEGLSGTWTGTCDLTAGVEEHYDLTYELVDDHGELSGTAVVLPDWMVESVDGTLSGTWDDPKVSLTAELGDASLSFVLDLEGKLDGDEISGDCASDAATGSGSISR